MNVTVDAKKAEKILRSSINQVQNNGWKLCSPFSLQIKAVILGTHKTYRYILLNGLLAKATNGNCNPLVLQAGSSLDGAFDARSLCHDIVVPIERELLGERLGASNEPFLNKPARFPELSTKNAVRGGNDTILLNKAIDTLGNVGPGKEALAALNDCIYWVFQRESRNLEDYLNGSTDSFQPSSLISFAKDLISASIEGETCAILSGAIFSLIGLHTGRNLDVKTHKVNQAGSSSKEISDIDVYENGSLVYTAEVKDKVFTPQDVEHAVGKVAIAGHDSLIFIKGPRGTLSKATEEDLVKLWQEKGFNLYFVKIFEYFTSVLSITSNVDKNEFMSWINHHADSAKIKDDTFTHLVQCSQRQNW